MTRGVSRGSVSSRPRSKQCGVSPAAAPPGETWFGNINNSEVSIQHEVKVVDIVNKAQVWLEFTRHCKTEDATASSKHTYSALLDTTQHRDLHRN